MRSKIALGIFVFLLSAPSFAGQPLTFSRVYLGVAGNGPGQGALGHAFLLLSDRSGSFFNSRSYQYNVEAPPNFKFNLINSIQIQNFPFRLYSQSGYEFISRYTDENRAVYLFELNVDPGVALKMQKDLEIEKEKRERSIFRDYDIASSNCLTKVYDFLNQYFYGDLRFKYVSPELMPFRFFAVSRDRLSIAVPVSAPLSLKRHPAVIKAYYFKPVEIKNYERLLEQNSTVKELGRVCQVREQTTDDLVTIGSSLRFASSKSYILTLQKIFWNCVGANPQAKILFVRVLDIVRYSTKQASIMSAVDELIDRL